MVKKIATININLLTLTNTMEKEYKPKKQLYNNIIIT